MSAVDGVTGSSEGVMTSSINKTLGKDDFLKLLIMELRYQDPMSPMDNKEFISQMAQFSALEQMNNMAEGFQNLTTTVEWAMSQFLAGQAVSYIGRTVKAEIPGEDMTETISGQVTGVKLIDGVPNILVNDRAVPVNYIEEVYP